MDRSEAPVPHHFEYLSHYIGYSLDDGVGGVELHPVAGVGDDDMPAFGGEPGIVLVFGDGLAGGEHDHRKIAHAGGFIQLRGAAGQILEVVGHSKKGAFLAPMRSDGGPNFAGHFSHLSDQAMGDAGAVSGRSAGEQAGKPLRSAGQEVEGEAYHSDAGQEGPTPGERYTTREHSAALFTGITPVGTNYGIDEDQAGYAIGMALLEQTND